jgi:precorrin-2 dehydrogenase/sirohydrochlorin ferrochelatase
MSTSESHHFPTIVKGSSFLLAWRLENRHVLLIGGGLVASGRLYYLLETGCRVTLISPREQLHPETAYRIDVSNTEDITYLDRKYLGPEEDEIKVGDYDMVLTAIDEVGLSSRICTACRKERVPVNVADVPPECDFYFGSQLRRGPLQIMVSTSGRGPKIAALIRKRIEESLPADIEQAIDSVGKLRGDLRKRAPGVGGPLGQRRMNWMIGICDKWNLDELGGMTDEVRQRLLDEGWDKKRVLGPRDVGVNSRSRVGEWWSTLEEAVGLNEERKKVLGVGLMGAVLGAAGTAGVWYLKTQRR